MTASAAASAHGRSNLQRFVGGYGQEIVVLLSIVALFVVVGAINPRFLSDTNINSIFAGNAYIAVAAIGMSMVIISGHIDVSVGALIGVIATIAGTLAVSGYPDLGRLAGADPRSASRSMPASARSSPIRAFPRSWSRSACSRS